MMRSPLLSPLPLLLAGLLAAFWPVWIWFARGVADQSNDYTSVLATATAMLVLVRTSCVRPPSFALALPAAAMVLYIAAVVYGAATAIGAAFACLALAALASAYRLGKRCDLAFAALCMLALPLAATLQFYLGYPLRVVAGVLTAALLKMNGLAVLREGASLVWDGRVIAIDAPCSGVRMLWTGCYLACALCALLGMGAGRTCAALVGAIGVVVMANALRAASLFYMEAGIVMLPGAAHEAIGMVCFVAAALAILALVQAIRGKS